MAASANTVVKTAAAPPSDSSFERKLAKALNFGAKDRVSFYHRLERFAGRGYDVKVALSGMYERYQKKKDPRRAIWREWVKGLNAGRKFSELVADYVPPAERLAISAGETTGELARGFEMARYIAHSASRIRGVVIEALLYPLILSTVFIALLYFVAYKLLPAMLQISPVEKWPTISYALYLVANYVKDWGWLTILGLIGAAIYVVVRLPKSTTGARVWLDGKLPPWTIYRRVQGANMLVTLSALSSAGNPVDESIRRMRKIASPWLNRHLDKFQRGVASGKRPADAMDTGLFDDEVMGEIIDYDRAGAFSDALDAVGKDVVDMTIASITRISGTIRYSMMGLVAMGLIWTYAAMSMIVMTMGNPGVVK